jgi:hypothetical protein
MDREVLGPIDREVVIGSIALAVLGAILALAGAGRFRRARAAFRPGDQLP